MKFKAEMRMTLEPVPDYGDVMTIKDFAGAVKATAFTNDDGHGYYGTETHMSNVYAKPSDIYKGDIDQRQPWTHVIWFNK